MKAVWNGAVIADSEDTVVVEGNHYFPRDAVDQALLRDSESSSVCNWKGTAAYYDVVVGDKVNADAAWYYPDPLPEARDVAGRVAFWRGVEVT